MGGSIRRPFGRRAGSVASTTRGGRRRRLLGVFVVLTAVALVWEAAKWLGGDPWRIHASIAGVAIDYEHFPPLKWRIADDLSLPHVWDVIRAFIDPAQRGGAPLGLVLLGQAAFTFAEALAGFVLGGLLGLAAGRARARALHRCFADRADPRHRPDRHRRDQGRLGVRHGSVGLPDVLPR